MAIEKIGGVGPIPQQPGGESGKQSFKNALGGAKSEQGAESVKGPKADSQVFKGAESLAKTSARPKIEANRSTRAAPASSVREQGAAQVVDRVHQAQARLDQVLRLAESGKTFTPAELLALQAHVYRASQELDLAGKVVEKATAGVKQILQTQV